MTSPTVMPLSRFDNPDLYRPEIETSGVDEKKLMRKVDWHVVPWLALLYLLNFLDRGSIGNAKLYHMDKDLGLTDKKYLIALTAFFFPYALFEPVSNVILRRLKPSIYLSTMIMIWGTIMTLHGVVKDYGGLLTVRLLLGLAEAGMFPGIVFYISSWYKRSEVGFRIAMIFSCATVAGAFSGLLAAAIVNMDGIGGRPGWAWVFILEGLATVLIGSASFWVIQDFPIHAKFISEEERVFIIRRLQDDLRFSAGGEKFEKKHIWSCFKDWKTYVSMALFMGLDGPLYAFSLFTPTIINQLGFTATRANLLSVPVYVWGCIITLITGIYGDRLGKRCLINMCFLPFGLIAYIILIVSTKPGLSYFAVYLAIPAIYATNPNSIAWITSNIEGSYKRSFSVGMAIGFGNLNGAVAANIYRAETSPRYQLGHGIVLAYISIAFISSVIFFHFLQKENQARDRGERDEIIEGVTNKNARQCNGRYASVDEAKEDKGDEWSGFRYTL